MKVRTRLIIAFLVIILVPFFMFGVMSFGFTRFEMKTLEEYYGVPMPLETLSDSMQIIGTATQEVFDSLKDVAEKQPEQLLDPVFLERVNEQLTEKQSYILVRKNESVYYNGAKELPIRLWNVLPAFREYRSESDGGSYIGKDINVFVKQLDIEMRDGAQVSVFVISSATKIIDQMQTLLRDLVLSMVVILCFTVLAMTVWIYTGINTPLRKLSEATHRIKEGDFEFELQTEGNDEISALCRDFDEMRRRLKELDEEKKNFDRQSRELISNISHDLKTPITAVKGYVEGIMDGVANTPEKMDRYIRTIYIKANDMDRLINELTFYSKIDTNRIPYNFNRINVYEYFDDCAEEMGLEMQERKIEFSYTNTVDPGVLVIADAEQIKRVINNIVGNSVKYMDKTRKIVQLRVLDAGDFIQVEIEDNGKGIPMKEIGYIFDRFYRTDLSRNSAQGGSGIGLSIVKKIVEDHGGRIWATSRFGEGTTMHLVLRKYHENVL